MGSCLWAPSIDVIHLHELHVVLVLGLTKVAHCELKLDRGCSQGWPRQSACDQILSDRAPIHERPLFPVQPIGVWLCVFYLLFSPCIWCEGETSARPWQAEPCEKFAQAAWWRCSSTWKTARSLELFEHVVLQLLVEKVVADIDPAVAPQEGKSVVEAPPRSVLFADQMPIANWCSHGGTQYCSKLKLPRPPLEQEEGQVKSCRSCWQLPWDAAPSSPQLHVPNFHCQEVASQWYQRPHRIPSLSGRGRCWHCQGSRSSAWACPWSIESEGLEAHHPLFPRRSCCRDRSPRSQSRDSEWPCPSSPWTSPWGQFQGPPTRWCRFQDVPRAEAKDVWT